MCGRKVIGLRSMVGMSGIPADGQDHLTMEPRGTVRAGSMEIADGVTTKVDGKVADGTMMTIMAIMVTAMPMDITGNPLSVFRERSTRPIRRVDPFCHATTDHQVICTVCSE